MDETQGWIGIAAVLAFVALPALVALLGVANLTRINRLQRRFIAVTGTVVELRPVWRPVWRPRGAIGDRSGDGAGFQAVFTYRGPQGKARRGVSATLRRGQDHAVGDSGSILVDPAIPEIVHERHGPRKTVALAMILIGGLVAVVGMAALGPTG